MHYVAFDVDGVLVDISERFNVAEKLSRYSGDFWNKFFNVDLIRLDRPREVVRELIKYKTEKYGLIIISGRPQKLYHSTLNQLTSFYNVRPAKIYMRSTYDYRPASIVKLELIEKALNEGFQIIEYHDDEEEVLNVIKHLYPSITLYLHSGASYSVYWESIKNYV